MKKILLVLVMVATMFLMPDVASASDKVKIYIFRGNTCNHCEEALNYLNNHKEEINKNVEVVTYEVFKNSNNAKLQDEVATKLGVDINDEKTYGVPFIVIGDQHITGYTGVTTFNTMMSIAEGYIDNDEYKDVVAETSKELNIKVKSMTLDELFQGPSKVATIVVYSIFGIAILGFIVMIVFSRRN